MNTVLRALSEHAAHRGDAPALSDGDRVLSYRALAGAVTVASKAFEGRPGAPVALALDNAVAWAIADFALLRVGRACVPLPPFFSPAQQVHALCDAGVRWLVTDRPQHYGDMLRRSDLPASRRPDIVLGPWRVACFALPDSDRPPLPEGTSKVTYTSGTTGTPKGVCLDHRAIAAVTGSLVEATGFDARDRHLALLPLATLLENVAGLYVPLSAGACAVLPPARQLATARATGTSGELPAIALAAQRATTTIMVPQLLRDLCTAIEAGAPRPELRFLAVGGAAVSSRLLQRAERLGLPVYQGYGLSECASVVALNTAGANRPGSVGRVLPHAAARIAEDGEIIVTGATFLGYAGKETAAGAEHATGDVGCFDRDGFLYVTGRKKNLFITSHGRNVSPEWVESELAASDAIAQAWVHGESEAWNVAVITPQPGAHRDAVDEAVQAANERLPEYARVGRWTYSLEPFSCANGQLTANGRLRREVLLERYRERLHHLYQEYSIELS